MKTSKVLITAGATREPIDQVRHISNFATGRLGVIMAYEADRRGYDTHLLMGYGTVDPPSHIPTVRFSTTHDLAEKVVKSIPTTDIYISTAAIANYAPVPQDGKIRSGKDELVIRLKPTVEILPLAREYAPKGAIFVGFKLEPGMPEEKLIEKAWNDYGGICDIVIANDLNRIGIKSHRAAVISQGVVIGISETKQDIARLTFNAIERLIQNA